ncbi:glucose-methanol-choline oxidoreductase [Ophiocordyceps sinensis CO18]|uniref:Glucose-methanol-choline oxidoreductase n=1 Tax=Ophiocordyceps sinensis (strain Co18 / CGMCC 3.14243) TaxID=911162 RepID=T5AHW2_OPHSC|nr:glucose-methanol-choline oxidoreductase [Ophiocordyceps sinensis CO18]
MSVDRRFIESLDPSEKYDYVIVGSGAGGAPLAARLASYGHRVLLVEAGDDQTDTYQYRVPALNLQASEFVPMTWSFYVTHYNDAKRQRQDSKMTWLTPSGQHFVGRNPPRGSTPYGILYPRAGTFGGCTAHNSMITVLPDQSDWQAIVDMTGDDSWAPAKMKKYFTRLERNRYIPSSYHGHGYEGWLTTSVTSLKFVIQDFKFTHMVLGAAASVGQGIGKIITTVHGLAEVFLRDLNSGLPDRDRRDGLFQVPRAIRDGARSGPREFVMEVMGARQENGEPKHHLDILLNTFVTRILFDKDDQGEKSPRATGVEYASGQSIYRADPRASKDRDMPLRPDGIITAQREVIISAGAFNTPQLLKLSGIGPREELEKFGIPVVVDSPGVGTNMQDRYEATLVAKNPHRFKLTSRCTWMKSYPDPCLENWKTSTPISKRGGYTTSGLVLAMLKRSSVSVDATPDLFISGAPAAFTGYYPGYSYDAFKDPTYWTWIVLKAHTRNRAGTVLLRTSDPRDTPIISFNSFDTGTNENREADLDAEALVEGMMWARKAIRNVPKFPSPFWEVWPAHRARTAEEMKDWVKKEAWGHHASCPCPIGADDDPMAVLDSSFRVRGVDGLRVVDASIFPKIPGYFIVLPIYMVSEKAADVIHLSTYPVSN